MSLLFLTATALLPASASTAQHMPWGMASAAVMHGSQRHLVVIPIGKNTAGCLHGLCMHLVQPLGLGTEWAAHVSSRLLQHCQVAPIPSLPPQGSLA